MKRMSVTRKLMISYCILIAGLMILMAVYILPTQLKTLSRGLEDKISWTARLVSEESDIIFAVENGEFSDSLKQRLDKTIADSDAIDYIVIVDLNDLRLYHPDHSLIGGTFAGGDEQKILEGASPYITTSQGSSQLQRRAFHSIKNENDKIIGFTMVSASLATIRRQQEKTVFLFALIFTVILGLSVLLAYFISKSIRKSLFGHEPGTFARMYLQREEILDNLAEGIIAVDAEGNFLYRNSSAENFLSEEYLPQDSSLWSPVEECRLSCEKKTGLMLEFNEHTLLVSVMLLVEKNPDAGILLIMRDRTDFTQMAEQMTGMNHVVDALRANTHEYLNKLHVISGLLQLGETTEAIQFIDGVTSDAENGYQTVVRLIKNRTIAALLLGKGSHAKELDIQFSLRKDSSLEAHNRYLSTKDLVTIIGNLIENAFDAVKGKEDIRQVEVFIGSGQNGITISVDDTGHGMTQEQINLIYEKQYTTKGEGHGIGLRLIQEIVRKNEGYLEIISDPGEGSSFTISISKERIIEKKVKTND